MSVTFSARELDLMREDQEVYFPETVTIKRRNLSDDDFGGVTSGALLTVVADVPARLTQAQVQDTLGQLSRDVQLEKWTIRLPLGTDVEEEDRIIWGDRTILVDDIKPRSFATVTTVMGELVK